MPIVLKSRSLNLLEPSGPVQACNGIALPLPSTVAWATESVVRLTISKCEFKWSRHVVYAHITLVIRVTYVLCRVATRYGLGGPGIESLWLRVLQQPFTQALGSTQHLVQWVTGLFPGGKAAGAWRSPSTSI